MTSTDEHKPGDPAPATGHYEELNVFGSHTGQVVHGTEGEPLPGAPRGFTWRRAMREDCWHATCETAQLDDDLASRVGLFNRLADSLAHSPKVIPP
jgi:hypothetical protein